MDYSNTRMCYFAHEQKEKHLHCLMILRNLLYILNSADADQHNMLDSIQHYNIDHKSPDNLDDLYKTFFYENYVNHHV